MQVYVTQGHEQGIGLEVFFKSCTLMSQERLKVLSLLAYENTVTETLKKLNLPYRIHKEHLSLGGIELKVQWLRDVEHSQSFTALKLGMRLAERGGVLFTLPTSKDQFPSHAGHTEYFRDYYQRPELGMFFSAPTLQVLLLTDHLPIMELSNTLSTEAIYLKINQAIQALKKWNWPIEKILVSGLNPHAGENGLIGHEDVRVSEALKRLRKVHQISMSGPLPGDTMLLNQGSSRDLLVYLFHDQGLGVFKGLQGFIGANITLGLPYPRVSPDHGTSFALYGRNSADYRGCAWSLKEAIALAKRTIYGQNSGQQSKST